MLARGKYVLSFLKLVKFCGNSRSGYIFIETAFAAVFWQKTK